MLGRGLHAMRARVSSDLKQTSHIFEIFNQGMSVISGNFQQTYETVVKRLSIGNIETQLTLVQIFNSLSLTKCKIIIK